MNRIILLIGIGGFLGSVGRYLVASFYTRIFVSPFPYGTFIVNITGCLLIGIFYGLTQRYNWLNAEWRVFLITGFCGGFTTFSSFAYENVILLQKGEYLTFILYTLGSLALGLISVVVGIVITRGAATF